MRPKAIDGWQTRRPAGLAGGEWPGRCYFVRDGRSLLPAAVPVVLTGAAQLQADGISSYCYTYNSTSIRHELRHARKGWPDTLVDPCHLSGCYPTFCTASCIIPFSTLTLTWTTLWRRQIKTHRWGQWRGRLKINSCHISHTVNQARSVWNTCFNTAMYFSLPGDKRFRNRSALLHKVSLVYHFWKYVNRKKSVFQNFCKCINC